MPAMKKSSSKKAQVPVKFTIDCSIPASDGIFDSAAFEKFLHDRIKVEGKTNNLSSIVAISRNASVLTVTVAPGTIAKRYLKYLAKKFLKKNQVRDYLRVVANSKGGYELRYLNLSGGDEEEEVEAADE
ncbi:hypothetical protein HDV05_004321 [Chytridiales sp. JEL 0842]|nr:hypothetical protein HDV05_004321 [Chytridiales sp. JEL 0842]